MTRRDQLLAIIRVAGYHNDSRTAIRVHVENRSIGRAAYLAAWGEGMAQRERGMPCACPQCKREAREAAA